MSKEHAKPSVTLHILRLNENRTRKERKFFLSLGFASTEVSVILLPQSQQVSDKSGFPEQSIINITDPLRTQLASEVPWKKTANIS
jgi:hypothetical protein